MPRAKGDFRKIKRRTVGQLDPNCAYNSDGLMRFAGLGDQTINRMRQEGVRAVQIGSRMFYRGKDVIRWLFRQEANSAPGANQEGD